jgi:hypothetical protein
MMTEGPASEESDTVLIQDMLAQVERVVVDASAPRTLGGPRLDLVVCSLGSSLLRDAAPGDTVSALGPWVLWIRGPLNWGCQASPTRYPCLLAGGRRKVACNMHVHGLRPQTG